MSHHPVILIPQDTTVLNFSGQQKRSDAGPTTKDSTHGIYLHCALAMTPEKVCLGVVSSKQWHRKELQKLPRKERTKKDLAAPIEEKESYRWLENYKKAHEYAQQLPATQIVSIADREGDIYEIYEEMMQYASKDGARAHFVIRAQHNRWVCTENGKRSANKIKETLKNEKILGQITLQVSEANKRKARTAHLEVYSKKLLIALPDKWKQSENYKPVEITAILCTELNPPSDAEALEWLLITDLAATTFEAACEKVEWYACRFQIEIFFKVLKSGCTIEKLQLTDNNFSAALNFYLIIAWRVLFVVVMGRHCPDISCECVFSKDEWQSTYVVLYRKKPPIAPPTLNEMTRMVAALGGYLNRKSDPEPGAKTIWIGLRNMQEHLKAKEAYEAAYGAICG
jgi:hypothetical protein